MFERKSHGFLCLLSAGILLSVGMFVHAALTQTQRMPQLEEKQAMARQLGLSDLCLFTDARYTRHPSMADLNTPFQDYPLSFEHFPSGSLMILPPHLQPPTKQR